jgi:hypothetical protein
MVYCSLRINTGSDQVVPGESGDCPYVLRLIKFYRLRGEFLVAAMPRCGLSPNRAGVPPHRQVSAPTKTWANVTGRNPEPSAVEAHRRADGKVSCSRRALR